MYPAKTITSILLLSGHAGRDRQSLQSILTQGGAFAKEIIICGAKDAEIIKYAQNLPGQPGRRILYPGENFEDALAQATGELMHILPAPDYLIMPDFLSSRADFLAANPDCQMCFSDARFLSPASGKAVESPARLLLRLTEGTPLEAASPMLASTFVFRSIVLALLGKQERLLLQGASMLSIWLAGRFVIRYLPEVQAAHYLAS